MSTLRTDGRKPGMVGKTIVDARGLSCPEPVLLAKKAIEGSAGGTIEVLVDTATGMENVTRMANALSCSVEVKEADDGSFVLRMEKD